MSLLREEGLIGALKSESAIAFSDDRITPIARGASSRFRSLESSKLLESNAVRTLNAEAEQGRDETG